MRRRHQPLDVSGPFPAERAVLFEIPGRLVRRLAPHAAPAALLQPRGYLEVEVADGEVRRLGPGDIVLVEDLAGTGHITRVVGDGPSTGVFVHLAGGRGGPVKFGIDLPNYGEFGDPACCWTLPSRPRRAGWDGFFLWDHCRPGRRTPVTDPWVVMSAVAVRTERIRFGPMVTPLARRRMNKLARETVALDHLSGGRLIMGVGLGHLR